MNARLATAGWRLIRESVRPHRIWSWFGIAAGLGWTVAHVSVPAIAGAAINQINGNGTQSLATWVIVLLVAGIFQALFTGLRRYAAFRLALRVETDLRMRLVAHLQRLHFAFHDEAQTGQLMANANSDIMQVQNVVLLIPLTIASDAHDGRGDRVARRAVPGLALFALGALPLLQISATMLLAPHVPDRHERNRTTLAAYSGVVEESITGIRVVKGFGSERAPGRPPRRGSRRACTNDRGRSAVCAHGSCRSSTSCRRSVSWGSSGTAGTRCCRRHLNDGDIVAANFYVLMLIWPLRMLGMLLGQVPRAVGRGGRVDEVLDDRSGASSTARAPGRAPARRPRRVALRRRAGSRTGAARTPVFDGLDLSIEAGEAVALVGRPASGKSTVARLDAALLRRRRRRASLHRRRRRARQRPPEVRRAVGIVFEDTFLFTDTVRDEHRVRRSRSAARARSSAPRSSPAPTSSSSGCPTGTTRWSASTATRLSGGQRQRDRHRRAVLADPRC